MMELLGRSYENGEPIRITIEGERILRVDPVWPEQPVSEWPWLAPGLFDLQINGHGGVWFSNESLTADDVLKTLEAHFRYGITRLCPTIITNSFEALSSGFAAIREACEREPWANQMVPGCHLEGPYISPEDGPRGAHPPEHVRPADWSEFEKLQRISGGRIRLVTLAPEVPNAIEFIEQAVAAGVVISLGHTAATADDIEAAVKAGAKLSTHLGNGAHGTLRRHPNYIWEQLGHPDLWASIITDGHHLPPSVARSFIRTKGLLNTILTCDASGLAGCKPGIYTEGSIDVEVLGDGPIVIAGQRQLLAGSGQETDTCVTNAMNMADLTLKQAIDLASRNPARLLRYEEHRLQRGSRADVIQFHLSEENRLEFVSTTMAGKVHYGEPASVR